MRHRITLWTAAALVGLAATAQAQQANDSAKATARPTAGATVKAREAGSGMATGKRMATGGSDEAAIREIDRKWVAAVAAKDTAYIRSIHAKDAADLPPNAKMVEGQDAVAASWAELSNTPGLKVEFEPTRIDFSQAGDVAYETGTYTYEQDNPKGGDKIQDHGKFVVVWRKTAGRWQVVRDIWNSDVAMPGM